jgi:hypothetical protein
MVARELSNSDCMPLTDVKIRVLRLQLLLYIARSVESLCESSPQASLFLHKLD